MTVLAHFGHQHAGAAPLLGLERRDVGDDLGEPFICLVSLSVHTRNATDLGLVAPEYVLKRLGTLAYRCPRPDRVDGQRKQVATSSCSSFEGCEGRLDLRCITGCFDVVKTFDLRGAHFGVVDIENVNRVFLGKPVLVDADDDVLTPVDSRLAASS